MERVLEERESGLTVWRIDLDAYAREPTLPRSHAEELARASSMLPDVARRYLTARHALRALLGDETSRSPEDIRLDTDALGKPVAQGIGLHFNLSRSGATCVVALCRRQPVGIDVETVRAMIDAERLARLHFTGTEREHWSRTRADADFLRCWTRKEACLKALGVGLRIAPHVVDAGCNDGARTVRVPVAGRSSQVQVRTLAGMTDCIAAVAFAGAADVEHARRVAALL